MKSRLVFLVLVASAMPGCQPQSELRKQILQVQEGRSHEIILRDTQVVDADLTELFSLTTLQALELYQTNISSQALRGISQLQQLRRLRLEGAAVDDFGVSVICKVRSLEVLNLPDADFTDAALVELANMPRLKLLRFGSPRVTDQGMAAVASMPDLRFLHLLDVPITDQGLVPLQGMQQLESFYLDGGRTTQEGLARLLKALPNLHFHRDQVHLGSDPNRGHE